MSRPSYAPFNEDDPSDVLAEFTRKKVCEAVERAIFSAEARAISDPKDRFMVITAGAITGVCCTAVAQIVPDDAAHQEIRAWLISYLPQALDNARGIIGLQPLPEPQ